VHFNFSGVSSAYHRVKCADDPSPHGNSFAGPARGGGRQDRARYGKIIRDKGLKAE